MRPYQGRHLASGAAVWTPGGRQTDERPTPSPSTDREATRARASQLVARPVYAGRHEGVQTENR